jgi:hypothetical protein
VAAADDLGPAESEASSVHSKPGCGHVRQSTSSHDKTAPDRHLGAMPHRVMAARSGAPGACRRNTPSRRSVARLQAAAGALRAKGNEHSGK